MPIRTSLWLTGLALLTGCAASTGGSQSGQGGALFAPILSVLEHPRCRNCHVADGIPRQYDASLPHGQNVRGGADGRGVPGLTCNSCHGTRNAPVALGAFAPPGAPNWHLAPASMVWVDQSASDICARLRDPASNGGKSPDALLRHFAEDPLVAWGWDPGPGRSVPPLSQIETTQVVQRWIEAGMPCPL